MARSKVWFVVRADSASVNACVDRDLQLESVSVGFGVESLEGLLTAEDKDVLRSSGCSGREP